MQTIYTFNDKVLKNSVSGKWLTKKSAPADEVKIGNQIWKTTNLAIDDGQGGIYTQTVNYGQGNVVEYYYTWDAAVRVASSITGWHLPTSSECNTLSNTIGGNLVAGDKLKSTYGWQSGNGTDDYGFAVFPAGYESSNSFGGFGNFAGFWTSTENGTNNAYYCYFDTNPYMSITNLNKTYGISVRLIKDAT